MTTFIVHLQGAAQYERFDGVTSFVGEDATGSFGIKANHARFMTSLVFGLARFRTGDDPWQYVAVPGALLYFVDNELSINTRRYLRDDNYGRISAALAEQLVAEEETLRQMKLSLRQMEEEILRRIWRMRRAGEVGL